MGFRYVRQIAGIGCFAAGLLLVACDGPRPDAVPSLRTSPAAPPTPPTVEATKAIPERSFAVWMEGVREEARRRGISAATVEAALGQVTPIARVVELDRGQPEFSLTFGRYLASAITERRVNEGRALMQTHAALLRALERKYGVPGRVLVAFWGMESNYGRVQGDYPVIDALATLAFDARREALFRDELFRALAILDQGHISLEKMKGSWAGAMGQTQFMPSKYLQFSVDEDGDGRKNIWESPADSLGSTANFVKSLGWDEGKTWGREVVLPDDFDATLASLDVDATEVVKPLAEWNRLGVRRVGGGTLPAVDVSAGLILPNGIKGPAFLLYDNYRIILKYNRSTFYAVAVGHLADRLEGAGGLARARVDDPLKRDDVVAMQQGLVMLGLLAGPADGTMGPATRRAVRAFQKANGMPPDGYADAQVIAAVKARAGSASVAPVLASQP